MAEMPEVRVSEGAIWIAFRYPGAAQWTAARIPPRGTTKFPPKQRIKSDEDVAGWTPLVAHVQIAAPKESGSDG